ncbi:polysaccharide deacetylase family protein [Enterovibrio sp. ZSDZ35]|uniref:Polysaccharide deacetylase family protein n=1 Tax=Enterovibrio qingdaonensis TaxID=2899818 RepID=A0ABT5QIJ0_9GAMM|nr:polysaccharide deacetylase family protein [Enterovibrio sp. ZSDZ35]MDD1780793.1 polysaccharide deacetylase family protein [Enterovibrio sp. ZSDZ35]
MSIIPLLLSSPALADNMSRPPLQTSPLDTIETPMFVSLGFDDNNDADGMRWVLETLAQYQNPKGNDKFANEALSASFFMLCGLSRENPEILTLWRQAAVNGHDISNHTETHPDDKVNWNPLESWMTAEQWEEEVTKCNALLSASEDDGGIGISNISGFRAPFLTYDDDTLQALVKSGIRYDASFPAGTTPSHDGTNNFWPYTLDHGSPEHDIAANEGWKPAISAYPGLWEIPVHTLIVPPDEEMANYGIAYSLRDKIAQNVPWFDHASGKGDNFDWNLYAEPAWGAAGLSGDDVFAIYAYNLDLRRKGNKAPLALGLHSAFYGYVNGQEHFGMPGSTVETRRRALKRFIEYALSKPDVRFVSHLELIDWMISPEPLTLCPIEEWNVYKTYTKGDTVIHQGKNYIAKWWTTQQIPALYENSPWEEVSVCTDTPEN